MICKSCLCRMSVNILPIFWLLLHRRLLHARLKVAASPTHLMLLKMESCVADSLMVS